MGADSPRQKVVMSWSGGKDGAGAHELRADPRYEVVAP